MNLKEKLKEINDLEKINRDGQADIKSTTEAVAELLQEYTGDDRVIPMKLYKMPESAPVFSSGIAKLDDIIAGGFRKGDVFTITAPSGTGKSTFARELLIRFSHQKIKCLYFSYEDRNEGLIEKLGDDIPDGYIPNMLTDRSLTWIEVRVLEGIVKYGVEAVFIDNLKAITDFTARNVNNSIEYAMQKVKEIAMKYNVMVFLCAHIRKEENRDIDLNSIKDSTAVADNSSIVIAIKRRPDENQDKKDREENGVRYSNLTTISIIKNRNNGMIKGFTLLFRPQGISGRYDEDTNIIPKQEIHDFTNQGME